MTIKFKQDITSTKFYFGTFKASNLISGSMANFTRKIVVVCFGVRLDFNY
jgi:hypothetical protein